MRKLPRMNRHHKESDRLKHIVESFPKLTVTVVGDLVADEFVFGEISRVSREAPVLILKHRERTLAPGGGGRPASESPAGTDGAGIRPSLRWIVAFRLRVRRSQSADTECDPGEGRRGSAAGHAGFSLSHAGIFRCYSGHA